MSLNLKNPDAHRLARALARETGETMTAAVTRAIRERLESVRRARNAAQLRSDLLAIGRRAARRARGPAVAHGDLLYDERGLPK